MKLLTLLKTLRPEELKEFERFLQFRSYKRGERYLKLWKHLQKEHPALDASKADMEALYKRCFGKAAYSDSKLYNLLSGMSRQVEDFLVMRLVLPTDDNPGERLHDVLLVKALGFRNAGGYFRSEAQRLMDEINSQPSKEWDDYLHLHQVSHTVFFNPDTPKHVDEPSNIQSAADNLDLYFCIGILRYTAEMKTREKIFSLHYEYPFLDIVLEKCRSSGWIENHPLVSIYYHLVQLYMSEVNEPRFRLASELFIKQFNLLSKTECRILLPHLINVGIYLSSREYPVHDQMLSLYKITIECGLLPFEGRITHFSFLNIVTFASVCGDLCWAKNFIQEFSPYLEEGKRQPAINFAMAYIHYYNGLLDDAQSCLTPDVFSTPGFEVVARGHLLKIVFDRYLFMGKDYEFLFSYLKTFEKFIKNQLIPEEKKQAQLNCIRLVRKMATLKFGKVNVPVENKQALLARLERTIPVVSKKWLAGRIDAL